MLLQLVSEEQLLKTASEILSKGDLTQQDLNELSQISIELTRRESDLDELQEEHELTVD